MGFKDTHAAVFAEGYEGDAAADLLAAYDEDASLSAAAVGELTTANEGLLAEAAASAEAYASEVNRLKAVNYDLLMQMPSAEGSDTDDTDIDADTEDGEGADTFDDLFTSLETDN